MILNEITRERVKKGRLRKEQEGNKKKELDPETSSERQRATGDTTAEISAVSLPAADVGLAGSKGL